MKNGYIYGYIFAMHSTFESGDLNQQLVKLLQTITDTVSDCVTQY